MSDVNDPPPDGKGDGEEERQKFLSLRWETKEHWPDLRKEFGVTKTGAAMILSLVTANDWLSYSRHKQHYTTPKRYQNRLYTYRKVTSAADRLERDGLIIHAKALPGQRGWQSAMKATPELIAVTNRIIEGRPLEIARPPEVIVLRNADKINIDYRETTFTRRARDEIESINDSIGNMRVDGCWLAPIRRIFNDTFSRGGRMYAQGGAWQTMKKIDRRKILIGDEPVVEIDYSTLHPALLYARVGKWVPADTYLIEGWPRKLAKLAVNVLINASKINSARLVIANSEGMADIAEVGSQEALKTADRLIADIKRVHAPIAQFFHSGIGLELQRQDSDMAVRVTLVMRMGGIDVLPVHDSFLVPKSKANILEECMWEVACEIGLDEAKYGRQSLSQWRAQG